MKIEHKRRLHQIIHNGAAVFGVPAENLCLTGGSIPRVIWGLPESDYDFVLLSGEFPNFCTSQLTDRAASQGNYQLLKKWSGKPNIYSGYPFDLDHCCGWATLDAETVPGSVLHKKLIVRIKNVDDPVNTLVRIIRWYGLGFIPESWSQLAPFVGLLSTTRLTLEQIKESLERNSGK